MQALAQIRRIERTCFPFVLGLRKENILLWGVPTERLLILDDAVIAFSGLKGSGYVCSRVAASSTASVRCATCTCTGHNCGITEDCNWCRLPEIFPCNGSFTDHKAAFSQNVLLGKHDSTALGCAYLGGA